MEIERSNWTKEQVQKGNGLRHAKRSISWVMQSWNNQELHQNVTVRNSSSNSTSHYFACMFGFERIELRWYGGIGDFRMWVYQCNKFFKCSEIVDELKVQSTSLFLKYKALKWHETYMVDKTDYPNWEDYIFDMKFWFT